MIDRLFISFMLLAAFAFFAMVAYGAGYSSGAQMVGDEIDLHFVFTPKQGVK